MPPGRKKRNIRNRRRNLLDVKLRSDQVRALRARGLAVTIGVLFGTVFTCYVGWRAAGWTLDQLIYENKAFEIRRIQVSTDGQIAVEYLQRWSGAQIGQNLMALDLAELKANLELLPNIESLAVERVLPSTLRIRVVEREPIARVVLPRLDQQGRGVLQAWLLAADGTVMMPVDPKYCASQDGLMPENLPALTGIRPNELRLGRAVEASRVHAALSFLQCFNRSGLGARIQLSSVELNQSGVLVVTTRDGARVTVAQDAFERQLARWRAIYEQGMRLGKRIRTVDLAVENNVPVRWADAG